MMPLEYRRPDEAVRRRRVLPWIVLAVVIAVLATAYFLVAFIIGGQPPGAPMGL